MVALMPALADLLLIGLLIAIAWFSLAARDLRRAVILFVAFGLLLALAWARLDAPDVALAEAAIGAGLTGALLLAALRDSPVQSVPTEGGRVSPPGGDQCSVIVKGLLALASLLLVTGLVWAYADGVGTNMGLADAVARALPQSGVSNPVTAVLLNFRALDTLLEIAVLLVALLGIFALNQERGAYRRPGPVVAAFVHWLVPLLIVSGGYLLWVGAHAPGGAFQAGALLAAAGVALRLGGFTELAMPSGAALRVSLVAGVAVFLTVGLGMMLTGRAFLEYPLALAGLLILVIEVAATVSIAVILASAFVGGHAPEARTRAARHRALSLPEPKRSSPDRQVSQC